MAKNEKSRNVKRTNPRMFLEVILTDAEMKAASKELADAVQRKHMIEDQIDTFKAQKKGEITQCEGEINLNTELVISGKTMRTVECEQIIDYDAGRVTVVRKDTGVIVIERSITSDEKQMELNV